MSNKVLKPLKKRLSNRRKLNKETSPFKLSKYITLEIIIKSICAFLLSCTKLIGGASPLGFAFFASSMGGIDAYIYAAFSLLGIIASGGKIVAIGKFCISAILFSLIYERFLPEKYKKPRTVASIAALCTLGSGIFLLFTTMTIGGYPLIYDFVVLITESATVWLAVLSFLTAMPLVYSLNIRRSLAPEESISLAFLAGGIICGLGDIGFPNVFSLAGTLCVLCVLAFASRFGSMHGCVAGIVMGVVYCISRGRIDACAASFAASGLCAGYFSSKGRWASCLSFIMTNAVITILSNGSTEVLINLFDAILASCILYFMPERLYNAINNLGSSTHPASELAANRLSFAASTLDKCEASFKNIFKLKDINEYNKVLLYRRTAYNACSGCGLRKYCWGRDGAATKQSLDTLMELSENGEMIKNENAPNHCLRAEQFIAEFKRMFNVYKNDCVWSSKIGEAQSSVYESFSAVSKLIRSVSGNILNSNECDITAAEDIKYRLKKEGIIAKEVFVSGRDDATKVYITLEGCGGFGRCEVAVEKVLFAATGKNFTRAGIRRCGECNFTYIVKPSFSISTAVAGAIKHNKKMSGDHAVYALINRETYAIILCDGMGSGEKARNESKLCATLLMNLLEAGLEAQSAINILNSMLISSFSDTLAAIDLCLISLVDGSAKIYKCGGAGTYTKTQNNVSVIDSSTLPLGASGLSCESYNVPSEKGSMIILVSDGIATSEKKGASWIKDMITEYSGTEPEPLARQILEQAKKNSGKMVKDDITVIAAYIG